MFILEAYFKASKFIFKGILAELEQIKLLLFVPDKYNISRFPRYQFQTKRKYHEQK